MLTYDGRDPDFAYLGRGVVGGVLAVVVTVVGVAVLGLGLSLLVSSGALTRLLGGA